MQGGYDELTGWHDFHARQYDATLGRWFGTDPQTSVLDTMCKAHELDNLYVVDTSFFVSIGAVNPSLTAIANALLATALAVHHLHQRQKMWFGS